MQKRFAINAEDYWKYVMGRMGKSTTRELSPYDIPKMIGTETKDNVLHIYFEYVDNEPDTLQVLDSGVRVKIGKHSGKVLGLEVDQDHEPIRESAQKLVRALDFIGHHAKRFNQKANYELAKAVFERTQDPLLSKS